MAASQSALIIGATGQTGRNLLQELLASSHFTRVGEYGRRVTAETDIKTGKEKLEQKVINFEKLGESGLSSGKWDVVFITLGTTRKNAGSAENFEKIDREYVINAAKEAKQENSSQRLVYLSSAGASSASSFLYTKSKGLTEEGLASLGYKETIVFRPGALQGVNRESPRILENIFVKLTDVLSHVSSSVGIPITTLAKAMCAAGTLGAEKLPPAAEAYKAGKEGAPYTIIPNSGALGLAKEAASE